MASLANPLKDIIIEDAGNGYFYGQYDQFKTLMTKEGFVNATKLCYAAKKTSKRLKNWIEAGPTKELINALVDDIKKTKGSSSAAGKDSVVFRIEYGPQDYRGYYIHPRLVPAIAAWACPRFALKAYDIVNEFINREAHERREAEERALRNELEQSKQEIKAKDDKIARLCHDMQEMKYQHCEEMADLRITCANLRNNGEDMAERADCATERLAHVASDIVVKQANPNKDEVFVIMRNGNYNHAASSIKPKRNKREDFLYIAMCGTLSYIKTRKSFMSRKQGYVEVATITNNPNAKNLLNRVRQLLAEESDVIEICYNWFNIIDSTMSESQLVEAIRRIDSDRYVTCDIDNLDESDCPYDFDPDFAM